MKSPSKTVQIKAIEQYSPVVLSIMLYKAVLTFLSLGMKSWSVTIQMNATEHYFSVVLFYYLVQGDSNFWICGWNPKVWPFK